MLADSIPVTAQSDCTDVQGPPAKAGKKKDEARSWLDGSVKLQLKSLEEQFTLFRGVLADMEKRRSVWEEWLGSPNSEEVTIPKLEEELQDEKVRWPLTRK